MRDRKANGKMLMSTHDPSTKIRLIAAYVHWYQGVLSIWVTQKAVGCSRLS